MAFSPPQQVDPLPDDGVKCGIDMEGFLHVMDEVVANIETFLDIESWKALEGAQPGRDLWDLAYSCYSCILF